MRPYYDEGGIQIFHGDCREVLPILAADVLVTDPPYGIAFRSNMHGARYETQATADRPVSIEGDDNTDLRDWVLSWWGDRPALIFGTWKVARPTATRHVLTWLKGDHLGMGDLSMPWKPNTEEVYVLGRGFAGHRGTSLLDYPAPVSWASGGRLHPHQKPIGLMSALLDKCPPGTVLDPFAGSGSTLVAAKLCGRRAIGIETDERHCENTVKRLAQGVLFGRETA